MRPASMREDMASLDITEAQTFESFKKMCMS